MRNRPAVLLSARACEGVILRFEEVLRRHQIQIVPGSALERCSLSAFQLAYGRLDRATAYPRDVRELYREMIGFTEFAASMTRALESEDVDAFRAHLSLLANGDPVQTTPSGGRDTAGNKLFEAFVGSAAERCGVNLVLEPPQESKSSNPDVLVTIRGQRWGFACKVPYSASPQSVLANIRSGIAQIEASTAETGAVIVSARSLLSHENYFRLSNEDAAASGAEPVFSAYRTPEEAKATVERDILLLGKTLVDHAGLPALEELFKGKKAIPAIAFWCHTVAAIPDARGRLRALGIGFLSLQSVIDPADGERAVFECLSRYMQSALPL